MQPGLAELPGERGTAGCWRQFCWAFRGRLPPPPGCRLLLAACSGSSVKYAFAWNHIGAPHLPTYSALPGSVVFFLPPSTQVLSLTGLFLGPRLSFSLIGGPEDAVRREEMWTDPHSHAPCLWWTVRACPTRPLPVVNFLRAFISRFLMGIFLMGIIFKGAQCSLVSSD